ncbi:MAG: hypothetical protein ACE5IL_06355 [Myxococcota bacterium]
MAEAARKLSRACREAAASAPLTLLELVRAVAEESDSDAEVLAVVRDLIDSGQVKLIGSFRGPDIRTR